MRVIVVGMGIQGVKRQRVAGSDAVASVDPFKPEATYRTVQEVPLDDYDAALVCTPDEAKLEILEYLLGNGKHILVEKPLIAPDAGPLERLGEIARRHDVTCYTAYNHRFEPHFMRMKALLDSGELGRVYRCRMFYGNGTARDVRNSAWRDKGAGVLPDLGSHLLDTVLFWFGQPSEPLAITSCHRFENRAFDHVVIGGEGSPAAGLPVLELEMTLLSWRNHFTCDILAEHGSAHIESLCKWGPSIFTHRKRQLPSGRPEEGAVTLVQPDPTWEAEYAHFKRICTSGKGNIDNDIWINAQLQKLANDSLNRNPE
ncbi:oxidoreductase [Skermanella aerolata KACC 11604]|nr:Gfo/Idh/MocA family oxidoreductase [Skermanella aerolata]KJB90249.1 oxidoreductase [Skermanella aerolata KACC 11604]